MKIIDLLNMIANGEEMPKRIKYNGDIFEFNERLYCCPQGDFYRLADVIYADFRNLTDEVELLEDEEIDIQDIKELEYIDTYEADATDIKLNREAIIQLTRAIKKLDNKFKEN